MNSAPSPTAAASFLICFCRPTAFSLPGFIGCRCSFLWVWSGLLGNTGFDRFFALLLHFAWLTLVLAGLLINFSRIWQRISWFFVAFDQCYRSRIHQILSKSWPNLQNCDGFYWKKKELAAEATSITAPASASAEADGNCIGVFFRNLNETKEKEEKKRKGIRRGRGCVLFLFHSFRLFFLLIPPSSFSLFFSFFLFILFEAARNRNRVRHASTPVGCRYFFFSCTEFCPTANNSVKKKEWQQKKPKNRHLLSLYAW